MRRAAVLTLVLVGCGRLLDLPPSPDPSNAVSCDSDAACATGHCVAGVCCPQACAATETCAAPGKAGTCTPRTLGDTCTADAECPSGHCSEGVCCDGACSGTCETCRAKDHVGTCRFTADNEDPRAECGLCGACFSGTCAPAAVGTDPNGGCGTGLVCGAGQSCGLAPGAACELRSVCARGDCVAGRCVATVAERVRIDPMLVSATERLVVGLAGTSGGDIAAVFAESVDDDSGRLENRAMLAVRSPDGTWRAHELFSDVDLPMSTAYALAGVGFLGRTVIVTGYDHTATDSGECGGANQPPCGLFARLFTPAGDAGPPETIDARAELPFFLALRVDSHGRAVLAYDSGEAVKVTRREVGGTGTDGKPLPPRWVPLGEMATNSGSYGFDFALADDRPVVVLSIDDPATVKLARFDPTETPVDADLPSGCEPTSAWAATLDRGSAPDGVLLTIRCGSRAFSPSATSVWIPGTAPVFTTWTGDEYTLVPLGGRDGHPVYGGIAEGTDGLDRRANLVWQDGAGSYQRVTTYEARGQELLGPRGMFPGVRPDAAPLFAVGVRDLGENLDFGRELVFVRADE